MADVSETLEGAMFDNSALDSGVGLKFGIYEGTKTTPADNMRFNTPEQFSGVIGAITINDTTGALDPTIITGSPPTTLGFSVGTGPITVFVWGYA